MTKILKLAILLDQFACAYDPYEYGDCVEDSIQNIAEITETIRNGRTEGMISWLRAIADDPDEETDDIETALLLLRSIKERMDEL